MRKGDKAIFAANSILAAAGLGLAWGSNRRAGTRHAGSAGCDSGQAGCSSRAGGLRLVRYEVGGRCCAIAHARVGVWGDGQAGGGGGRHGSAGQGGRRRGRNAGAAACFHPLGRRWQMKAGGSLSGFCLPVRSVRWMGVGQGSWTVNDYIPPGGCLSAWATSCLPAVLAMCATLRTAR